MFTKINQIIYVIPYAANLLFYMSLLAIAVFLDAGLPNDLAAI
jgi:hypothetical protein